MWANESTSYLNQAGAVLQSVMKVTGVSVKISASGAGGICVCVSGTGDNYISEAGGVVLKDLVPAMKLMRILVTLLRGDVTVYPEES